MRLLKKSDEKIVISAAYGMRNLGDEAICETIINDIFSVNDKARVTILVFNKTLFFKTHPYWREDKRINVESMNYRKRTYVRPFEFLSLIKGIFEILSCNLFIWGGGGIVRNRPDWLKIYIIPLRIAQLFRKKIIILSIGVNKINKQLVIDLVRKIKKVNFLSVRDEASKRNLLNVLDTFRENEIQVIRDPVFHFSNSKVTANLSNEFYNIGLNLSFWKANFSKKDEINKFVNSLARIFNETFKKRNYKIIYLPTAPSKDNVLFEELRSKLLSEIQVDFPVINTPCEYLDHLSKLNLFIGMRMHSIIFASNIDKLPIFTIIYDEKMMALKQELNLLNNIWTIDEVVYKPELLTRRIFECLKRPEFCITDFKEFKENSEKIIYKLKSYL